MVMVCLEQDIGLDISVVKKLPTETKISSQAPAMNKHQLCETSKLIIIDRSRNIDLVHSKYVEKE
jgi:hypothetical protein